MNKDCQIGVCWFQFEYLRLIYYSSLSIEWNKNEITLNKNGIRWFISDPWMR